MAQGELFEPTAADFEGMKPVEAFHSLGEDARMVGYALAWLHEPISMSKLTNRLALARIRTRGGKRIPNSLVKESLQLLHKAGVATLRKGGTYHINWTASHYLVAEIHDDPDLLAKLRELPLHDYRGYTGFNSSSYRYDDWDSGHLHAVRDLREKYYEGDVEQLGRLVDSIQKVRGEVSWEFVLHPLRVEKLRALPPDIFRSAAHWCTREVTNHPSEAGELLDLMVERAETPEDWRAIGMLALFRADCATAGRATESLKGLDSPMALVMAMEIRGAAAFLNGDDEGALSAFEQSMTLWRKATRKRKCCPHDLFGIWFVGSLLREGGAEELSAAAELADLGARMYPGWQICFDALRDLSEVMSGGEMVGFGSELQRVAPTWLSNPDPGLCDLFFFMLAYLVTRENLSGVDCAAALERLRERSQRVGALWLAAEASALRDAWLGNPSAAQEKQTAAHWARLGPEARPFSTSFSPPEAWERTVLALESLGHKFAGKGKKKKGAKKKAAAKKQLIWCLTIYDYGWNLQPIERTVSAKGKLSKGRRVSLKRLKERNAEMPHLTEQDRKLAMHISRYSTWGSQDYALDRPRALLDLAGHPLVFADEAATRPIELVKVSPRLTVTGTKEGAVKLELSPKGDYSRAEPELIVESPTRYLVLDRREVHVRLHELLGPGVAELPAGTRERVVKALGVLSEQLAIESDEGTLGDVGIETVGADPQPVLRLFPHGEGLHARILIRPIPGGEMSCEPGEGKAITFAVRGGQQVQARRDLEAERSAALAVLKA
ncbi:MAG: hypothetical protein GWO24_02260, partial [Akkermansiaceae bacterium]|nr:hypothetical protein [Akkermansiaceae bacterium]